MNVFYGFASHSVFSSQQNRLLRGLFYACLRQLFCVFCLICAYGSVFSPAWAQEPLGKHESRSSARSSTLSSAFSSSFVSAFLDAGYPQVSQVDQDGQTEAKGDKLANVQEKKIPIDMDADNLEMDRKKGVIKAEGNVYITRTGTLELRADRATYLFLSKQIEASGNIRLVHEGDLFTGERVILDVERQSGSMQQVNVNLRGPGGQATAKAVTFRHEKEGVDRDFVLLKDASFTNCECEFGPNLPAPPWHFTSDKVEVDRADNSVTARNIKLYAAGVPVFMLPWWQQPLIPKRKSGFLQPSFRVSGNGFETEVPYYWNIAENRDATVALRSVSRRGLLTKLQYRYLDQKIKGQLDTQGIYDTLDEEFRGMTVFEYEHKLGDWQLLSHVNASHTRDFINDFEQKLVDNRSRRLESVATMDRIWMHDRGYTNFQSGMRWYQDLEKDNDDFTVQSLPFIVVTNSHIMGGSQDSGDDSDLLRGHWRLDSEASVDNFYQLSGDSSQRINVAPTVHFDKQIYIGRMSAALGLRETAYLLQGDPNQTGMDRDRMLHRESAMLSLRLDGTLRKLYSNTFLHTLEPSIQYVLNTATEQNKLPNYDASLRNFTITDIFARNLYSGVDRISDGQWIGYGLTSRILSHAGDNAILEEGVFTIGQRWAPEGERKHQDGHAFSSLASSLEVNVAEGISFATTVSYNTYREEIESSDTIVSIAFADTPQDETTKILQSGQVMLGHHFNSPDFSVNPNFVDQTSFGMSSLIDNLRENGREKVEDISLDASLRLAERWSWKQKTDYSLEFSELKSWGAGLTYEHQCWDLTLTGGRELATTTNKHGGGFIGFFINLQGLGGVGI